MKQIVLYAVGFIILFLLALDIFTYQGFVSAYFGVEPKFLLVLSLISSFTLSILPSKNLIHSKRLFISAVLIFVVYLLALTVEGINHQG